MKDRYFACHGAPEKVAPYLYNHTKIVLSLILHSNDGKQIHAQVMQTQAEENDRADFLADYQAERLASGMMACTETTTDFSCSVRHIIERIEMHLP